MEHSLKSRYLYRYRSLAGTGLQRTEKIVREAKMYFANPASFNDPFDCRPAFSLDGTAEEVKKYFAGVYRRQAPHLDRSTRRAEIRKNFKTPSKAPNSPEALDRFADFYYADISGRVGLLCLTDKPDDLLMWSHYANSHTGLCLGFNKEAPSFAIAQPVRYSDTRPIINPVKQTPEQMLDLALYTKARHWMYEAESRIVHYKGGPGEYSHPASDLQCIILGAMISEEDKRAVMQWVHDRIHRPMLLQAHLSKSTFALQILPME